MVPDLHVFTFKWWWDLSNEKGNGFFVATRRPHNEYGGPPYARYYYTSVYGRLDEESDISILRGFLGV